MSVDHPDNPPGRTIVPPPLPVARGFVHMPTAPFAYSSARFERQTRIQGPLNVAYPLPEGFDGDESRRWLVPHVSEDSDSFNHVGDSHVAERCVVHASEVFHPFSL